MLVDVRSISVGAVCIARKNVMNAILFLLAMSTLVGLVLGASSFRLIALVVSGVTLAILAATVLQTEGFSFLCAGIATIVVCLTVNQLALSDWSGAG